MAFEGAGKVAGLEIWRIEVIYTALNILCLISYFFAKNRKR
jgi:hypothetical protein